MQTEPKTNFRNLKCSISYAANLVPIALLLTVYRSVNTVQWAKDTCSVNRIRSNNQIVKIKEAHWTICRAFPSVKNHLLFGQDWAGTEYDFETKTSCLNNKKTSIATVRDQKPNSWTYSFVEVSEDNHESSQAWVYNCKPVTNHLSSGGGGGGVKNVGLCEGVKQGGKKFR
jgi:hypothetical protein